MPATRLAPRHSEGFEELVAQLVFEVADELLPLRRGQKANELHGLEVVDMRMPSGIHRDDAIGVVEQVRRPAEQDFQVDLVGVFEEGARI